MNELTPGQVAELRESLVAMREELRQLLSLTRNGTKPVDVEEPIGRLTRIDAIQQQSMSAASRRELDIRLRQVQQALGLMERGDFGACRRCDDPIGYARLKARPESPYCLECQDEIDLKHG